MAALITHLVIGERVYPQAPQLEKTPYGTFLLGCLAPDVSILGEVDRLDTHFVGRVSQDGEDAFTESSARFLDRRAALIKRPWGELSADEAAFVAGYLCHLAADEAWKAWGWRSMQKMDLVSLQSDGRAPSLRAFRDVPAGVFTTAGSVLSAEMYLDFPAVVAALRDARMPDVLTHIPHSALARMWDVLRPYAMDGRTYQAYLQLLADQGQSEAEVDAARQEHEEYWGSAVGLIRDMGGVEPAVLACVERAVMVLPRLWREEPQ